MPNTKEALVLGSLPSSSRLNFVVACSAESGKGLRFVPAAEAAGAAVGAQLKWMGQDTHVCRSCRSKSFSPAPTSYGKDRHNNIGSRVCHSPFVYPPSGGARSRKQDQAHFRAAAARKKTRFSSSGCSKDRAFFEQRLLEKSWAGRVAYYGESLITNSTVRVFIHQMRVFLT